MARVDKVSLFSFGDCSTFGLNLESWFAMRFGLIRLVVICIWRCVGGLMLVGANSTCTLVLLILFRFPESVDNEGDRFPEVAAILLDVMDAVPFIFSFGLGLSTFRRDTDPRELECIVVFENCTLLQFPNANILLGLDPVNEIPGSLVTNKDAFSSSSKFPSYSRISSVT